MKRKPLRSELLQTRLNELVATFDITTIEPDPLQLVLRYDHPQDQEVAGLLAAAFAYGRADTVVANVGRVLDAMGPSPHAYVASFRRSDGEKRFARFAHRFHKTGHLLALLERMSAATSVYGSLGALFQTSYDHRDTDIGPSLARFVGALIDGCGLPLPELPADERRGLHYLLSSPDDGSACKRMNLFLRWMVRRTSPDLGIWAFVDPAKLVMPLDTHVHRIATFLGLSERKSADWKAARAVTDRLARFDPSDPVRYDFALCRLGILDRCSRRRRKENCDVCLLRDVCRFPVV
ncbi:MAG: TIGR02757 family protein [Thermoanaerobaculia bacterium]